jgi:RHS repeat-associated protein
VLIDVPSVVEAPYAYDAADELLTESVGSVATVTNTWSANGALATSTTPTGTKVYTTDLTDELISLTLEDGSLVGYTQDAQGNRTSRTVDGVVDATWAWDDLSSLPTRIGEYDAFGTLTTAWLADPTSSTGASLAQTSGGVSSWLLSDPFANTVAAVSTTGDTVSGTRTMDAFGVERSAATGALADAAVGFAGQYLDAATGLYDMRARDYDPSSGRFTATDPVQVPTGMPYVAGYSYAFNNPLMFTDVSGAWPDFGDLWTYAKGVASGTWEIALNTYALTSRDMSVGVTKRRAAIVQSFMLGVEDYGWGIQIDRTLNPVHQLLEAGDAWIQAMKAEDYEAAGRAAPSVVLAEANTCLVAYGGAKFVSAKLPVGAANTKLPGLMTSRAQLEAKFKHATDFGVTDARGAAGFDSFGAAVKSFVSDASTIRVTGTYRSNPAILNYNTASRLVVVQDMSGAFVSGWQMSPAQLANVIKNRSLGGG